MALAHARLAVTVLVTGGLLLSAGAGRRARADAPASAPNAGLEDEVDLASGAFVRGAIVEFEPGSHVVLKLANGELRRIPIAEVRAAIRGGRPLPLAGEPAVPGPAEPPPDLGPIPATSDLARELGKIPGPRVRLEVTSNRMAMLERQISDVEGTEIVAYHIVCMLPCRIPLPVADPQNYRIGGYGSQPTPWFKLPSADSQLRAQLSGASSHLWPPATLLGAVLFGAIGGGFLALHAIADTGRWSQITGWGFAGVGGAFLLTSGVLWAAVPDSNYSLRPLGKP